MELLSFRQLAIVDDLLRQIRKAILDLQEWNRDIQDADDWLTSSDGMKTLAASCMLIEAIGEGYGILMNGHQDSSWLTGQRYHGDKS